MTREEKRKRNLEIVECYKQGHTRNEIAKIYGLHQSRVGDILRDAGFVLSRNHTEEWAKEQLDEGFEYIGGFKGVDHYITIKRIECGHIFEKSMKSIIDKRRKNPIACPICQGKTTQQSKHSREWVEKQIDEGFEYLGGFKNTYSNITIKCKKCGLVFERSWTTIRNRKYEDEERKTICPSCRKADSEKRQAEKRREIEEKKLERETEKQERDNAIIELRKEGCSMNEIARQLNVSKDIVRTALRKVGLGGSATGAGVKHSEDWVREKIDKGFEYVGGFKNVDSYITLKCKECGYIFERSFITIRKGRRTECPECKRMAKIQKEIEWKEWEERRQREETYNRLVKQFKDKSNKYRYCKQTTMKTCKCCGNIFFTDKDISYCSKRCVNRVHNKNSEHARRTRMKEQMVDKDITIEGLFNRDKGKCALCGGICEWNDYTKKDNYFIAGNFYPSIDHIIPLSKGGLHSWENVQLAHRICNTRKSNKSPLCV